MEYGRILALRMENYEIQFVKVFIKITHIEKHPFCTWNASNAISSGEGKRGFSLMMTGVKLKKFVCPEGIKNCAGVHVLKGDCERGTKYKFSPSEAHFILS